MKAHPNCEYMLSDNIHAFRRTGSELHVVGSSRATDRGDDASPGSKPRAEAGDAGTSEAQFRGVMGHVSDCERLRYAESFPQPCSLSGQGEKAMKMTTAKAALKGKVLAPRNGQDNLAEQAKQLDRQVRAAVKAAQRSLTELGRLLAQMRELALWEYLPGHYRGWEHYAQAVMGPRARSSLHEILAAYSLTGGAHAIPSEVVNKMGVKRAAQVARLKPEQRTPAIIHAATSQPVTAVKQVVQETLNMELAPDEQKEATQLFAINLPASTVAGLEELMEVGIWMEGIRDGDRTQTMRQKFFGVMIVATREYYAQELAEAMRYKAARGARENGTPQATEEEGAAEEGAVPEPEELEEFAAAETQAVRGGG